MANSYDINHDFIVKNLSKDSIRANTPTPSVIRSLDRLSSLYCARIDAIIQVLLHPRQEHCALFLRNLAQTLLSWLGPAYMPAHSAIMAIRLTSSVVYRVPSSSAKASWYASRSAASSTYSKAASRTTSEKLFPIKSAYACIQSRSSGEKRIAVETIAMMPTSFEFSIALRCSAIISWVDSRVNKGIAHI